MKPLRNTYKQAGCKMTVIKRVGDVCLAQGEHPTRQIPYYEVFIVQKHNGFEAWGEVFEPAESMPKTHHWGLLGWSYSGSQGRQLAEQRFNSCVEAYKDADSDPNAPTRNDFDAPDGIQIPPATQNAPRSDG